jgi:superfamily II DNA/RNA helicase
MDHHLLVIAPTEKAGVTAEIANRTGRTIMFARTKRGADRLAKELAKVGVRAGTLHGGKRQGLRTRTLAGFREGSFGVLIATDVAARGLHVDDVSLVVHIDPPTDHKGYLHRAGRTARAGGQGTVVTLVLPDQVRATSSLIRRAGVEAARTKVRAGDAELVRLTGARPPSGHPTAEPMTESAPATKRKGRSPAARRRHSTGNTGGRGRAIAGGRAATSTSGQSGADTRGTARSGKAGTGKGNIDRGRHHPRHRRDLRNEGRPARPR